MVRNLFDRGRRICSPEYLEEETAFLRAVLTRNGYPFWFIDKHSQPPLPPRASCLKKTIYFGTLYTGEACVREIGRVKRAVESAYPHINAVPWYRTTKLAQNAPKDFIPSTQRPLVIYSYRCACGASYVGRTERSLEKRSKEHLPKWCLDERARPRSTSIPSSSITQHHMVCSESPSRENFKVVRQCRNSHQLKVCEMVLIHLTKPSLCVQKDFVFTLSLLS